MLERSIGHGGYGAINLVTDPRTGTKYVAKMSDKDIDSSDFIIEISNLMCVKHARNVIHIIDIDPYLVRSGGRVEYMVYILLIILPLYKGNGSKYGPNSGEKLRYAMFDVCNGMLSLYNRNIQHLDLKPENILYDPSTEFSPYGHYVIADLGMGLRVQTIRGEVHSCYKQTLYYSSPELALSRLCNRQCIYNSAIDLWSIGVIMGQWAIRKS